MYCTNVIMKCVSLKKNKYTVYMYTVCTEVGYGVLILRQIHTYRKVLLQVIFLDDNILHCLL